MTEISFHVNITDKFDYACRLIRLAHKKSTHVLVVAPAQTLQTLSTKLWAMSETEFLPHCMVNASTEILASSPTILATDTQMSTLTVSEPYQAGVLLNLGDDVPSYFDQFSKLIELVCQETQDTAHARLRWKQYKDQAYVLTRYDALTKLSQQY